MKKGIINILLFGLPLFVGLYVIEYIVDQGLRKSEMQNLAVWNNIYGSKVNADMLICGGSRAKIVISPKVLDSVLGINSYNVGVNGSYIPIQIALLKIYLQHNIKPKYILLNVDFGTMSNMPHLSNSDQYIPYLDDTIIRNVTSQYIERFSKAEIYLPLFKYNNHMNLIKEGIFCYFNSKKKAHNKLYKGFAGWTIPFDNYFAIRAKNEADFLRNNIQKDIEAQFVAYINFCKTNDIKLIFTYIPVLQNVTELMKKDTSEITRRIIYYAKTYDIPYISYLDDSMCYRKELFADHIHLNNAGAQILSEKLALDLKGIVAGTK